MSSDMVNIKTDIKPKGEGEMNICVHSVVRVYLHRTKVEFYDNTHVFFGFGE